MLVKGKQLVLGLIVSSLYMRVYGVDFYVDFCRLIYLKFSLLSLENHESF